jgi:hypothetical protein
MLLDVPSSIPLWRRVLRVVALAVTVLSIGGMLYPDAVGGSLLSLGLGGQFVVGTVLIGALGVEILARVTDDVK